MDTVNFLEAVEKTTLPFIYCGEKLNDKKCQKALNKLKPEGKVLAMILSEGINIEGLIVTDKGIWFAFAKGNINIIIPKTKGSFLFDKFILHSATVKKTFLNDYNIELTIWDIIKRKSFTYSFELSENYYDEQNKSSDDLLEILKTLMSKTGTEYVEPEDKGAENNTLAQPIEDAPNTFKFLWGNFFMNYHTIIVLKDDLLTINTYKFDDNTKIQTPKGPPVTISKATIASVKKGRAFSPITVLMGIILGFIVGFIGIGGIVTVILSTTIGLLLAFPKKLVIIRKDGTKFKIRFQGNENDLKNYERFINEMFS